MLRLPHLKVRIYISGFVVEGHLLALLQFVPMLICDSGMIAMNIHPPVATFKDSSFLLAEVELGDNPCDGLEHPDIFVGLF